MHCEPVNRAVPLDIAGEVQDKTVDLSGRSSNTSTDLLNVLARAHRRTKHSNEIYFGNIESDRKHIDSNKTSNLARTEIGYDALTFKTHSMRRDHFRFDFLLPQNADNVLGVLDA
jgi:hypothetical protein